MQRLHSAVRLFPQLPVSHKACVRKLSNTAETFYSSQSGRVMRVPGSAGTRIHDITPAGWQTNNQRANLLRKLCSAHPDSVLVWPSALTELKELQSESLKPTKLAFDVENMHDLEEAFKCKDLISIVCIYGNCSNNDELRAALDLAVAAKREGLQVRAYITDPFESADGKSTDPSAVQDAVVGLADADADHIVLSDVSHKSCSDSLRDVVEAALWVDVVGESMLERLGLRASVGMCIEASKLGVSRFDTVLKPQAEGIASTSELLAALEREGRRHGMDASQLSSILP